MARYEFTRGLHDLGNGCFAYLQPNGGWGWSNAGLIVSKGESLLVDTLADVPLTRTMLGEMRRKVLHAGRIDTVVITHANADHFLGNELVADSRILATKKTKSAIEQFNPALTAGMQRDWMKFGDAGWFFHEVVGDSFDFQQVTLTPPNQSFERETTLRVGDKAVVVTDLGPAHTESDIIVHVPEDKVVYTGDLLFNQGHPVIWNGPFANWIAACDHILGLDVDTVVPGHGPIAGKPEVRALRHYFEYVRAEARRRFDAGLDFFAAAKDIETDAFRDWIDGERLVANVLAAYNEFDPGHLTQADPQLRAASENVFALMCKWIKECGWGPGHSNSGHAY